MPKDMNVNLCKKILASDQIRSADQYTIKYEPISSIDLMERAAERFIEAYLLYYSKEFPVTILCGTGNNGGDGLAIGHLLIDEGYQVRIYIIGDQEKGSDDFSTNNELVRVYTEPTSIVTQVNFPVLTKDTIVIDALFGIGLSRPITGLIATLIQYINEAKTKEVVAVDIASGLGCEDKQSNNVIMKTSRTITFQVPKLSFFLPENEDYTGAISNVNIGLNKSYIDTFPSDHFLITDTFIKSILKPRSKFMHKGSSGRNLLIAGSFGKMGAAVLAAKANLRSGSGLLTCYIPKSGVQILQCTIPEAMVMVSTGDDYLEQDDDLELDNYDAVGIGPGISQESKTVIFLDHLLNQVNKPIVVDADALNILSSKPEMFKKLPKSSILTPHPGEFIKMVGDWVDDYDRLKLQRDFSLKHQVVVILKGAHTSITTANGEVFFNDTGNAGMATAGSGDVLTGVITALIGQGYDTIEAALLGVYLHGKSGDLYAEEFSQESLIASDLIDSLGIAYQYLKQ